MEHWVKKVNLVFDKTWCLKETLNSSKNFSENILEMPYAQEIHF